VDRLCEPTQCILRLFGSDQVVAYRQTGEDGLAIIGSLLLAFRFLLRCSFHE